MPKNNIINLFEEILDTSSILSGDELKSRFYHIWKTDISLESLCLLLPKSSEEISAIVKYVMIIIKRLLSMEALQILLVQQFQIEAK